MKKVLGIVGMWLIAVNLFGLVALNRLNVAPDTAYPWIDPVKTTQTQSWNLLDLHSRWDSNWYRGIAENGYAYQGPAQLSNIVFFPVYPLLARFISFFVGGNFLLAAWLLSIAALLGACIFLYKLVKENHPDIDPVAPIVFLLIFPTAFFFNAIYTESLFLFLSIAVFYYCFKGNFWLAGIFAFFAALTRVTGVLLFAPLLMEYYQSRKGRLMSKDALALLLAPLGTALFFLYHYISLGDFFAFFKVEEAWGRAFQFNPEHFNVLTPAALANFSLDGFFVIVIIILILLVAKRLRISYAVYMALTIAAALSTGTFMSIGRYAAVLFPMYIFAASIKSQYTKYAWVFVSVLLLALNITLFVHFHWAG
jgi:Gpi18-like mannosyltransferase